MEDDAVLQNFIDHNAVGDAFPCVFNLTVDLDTTALMVVVVLGVIQAGDFIEHGGG